MCAAYWPVCFSETTLFPRTPRPTRAPTDFQNPQPTQAPTVPCHYISVTGELPDFSVVVVGSNDGKPAYETPVAGHRIEWVGFIQRWTLSYLGFFYIAPPQYTGMVPPVNVGAVSWQDPNNPATVVLLTMTCQTYVSGFPSRAPTAPTPSPHVGM